MKHNLAGLVALCAACETKNPDRLCEKATVTGFSDSAYVFAGYDLKCEGAKPAIATLKLNETSFTDFFKSADAITRLDASEVSTSASSAAERWNAAAAQVSINVKVKSSGVEAVEGTKTILLMSTSDDALKFGEAVIDIYDDEMIDCDVVIFSHHKKTSSSSSTVTNWSTDTDPPDNGMNLQDVMAHEFGHCLGLGDQTSAHKTSQMYTWGLGDTINALSTTDIAALQFLYPT